VIFHSDRGSQYTSNLFRRLLDEIDFRQSLSAPGCPYDNAVVESFFKFLVA
ncbi:MAG: transposase family protein, partial [Synergistaceae bacterium]|nr:transposase family protein [Synergistaceae bacterium]